MNILLVVDMQNDFIDGSLGTKEAQGIVPFVTQRIKESTNDLILFTQDTHDDNYLNTQEGGKLPINHCQKGSRGWNIHPLLISAWENNTYTKKIPSLKNNALIKHTFGSKELIALLTKLDLPVEQVEILGLCTDICVISNALVIKAYFPETIINVTEKGCAGVTPENHLTALNALRNCQVNII